MRIDKFLKISRIIKRRPVAKKITDQGRVFVNGQVAKSSTKVNIGDKILIKFGNKTLEVKVLRLADTTKRSDADNLYKVLSEKVERDFKQENNELL